MPDAVFSTEPPLAFLTFNRPAARNAMNWEMYDALARACAEVDAARDLRVLVLRGAGAAFSAGTDIALFRDCRTADDGIAYERRLEAVIDRLERMRKATIAQVDGVATGAGCVIALLCDLRVCTPAARFGVPVARTLGNCVSAENTARMIDVLGVAAFKDLMLTARLMTAEEASRAGLVARLADSDTIDAATREVATAVAANAPLTIAATKEILHRVQTARRAASEAADDLVGLCYGSRDFREGVDSFLAKRPPQWTGA